MNKQKIIRFFLVQILYIAFFATLSFASSIYVNENGNVGIGTIDPEAALHIDTETVPIKFHRAGGAGSGILTINNIMSSTGSDMVYYPLPDKNGIGGHAFYTSNSGARSFAMGIDNSGSVGIGTTRPEAALHIKTGIIPFKFYRAGGAGSGILTINNIMSSTGSDMVYYPQPDGNRAGGHAFYTSNAGTKSFAMGIDSSGKVGIGTKNPSYKLDVNGTIRGSNVSPSDVRWKTNINIIDNALERVSQLRGVTYEWIDPAKGVGEKVGVIAQEVEDVFPQVVSTDNEGYKSVAYDKLIGPLIEAVKDLKAENEMLKKRIEVLENK